MIEGIKIEMTTEELRAHVAARAEYHEQKAEWYLKQTASLAEGREEQWNVSNDPTQSLKRSATEHQEKSAFFHVIAEHLIPAEVYRLVQADLVQLEFFSRYF
jgi:hypothetical protein